MPRFASAFAFIGVLIISLLAVPASAQRGAATAITSVPCNHTLTAVTPNITNYGSVVDFYPDKPGRYIFTFESLDLCVGKNITAEVCVKCPPPPIVRVQRSQPVVKQGGTVIFTSDGTQVNNTGDWVKNGLTYKWSISKFPLTISNNDRASFGLSSTSSTFETPQLRVNGEYEVQLDVTDGCSVSTAVSSFTVECNCGPTANAGATQTIWTNGPSVPSLGQQILDNLRNQVNNQMNEAGLGTPFVLDGSLSTDFDLIHSAPGQEQLTYDWTIVSWVPAGPMPYATLRASSTTEVGIPFPQWPLYPTPAAQFSAANPWLTAVSSKISPSSVSYGYEVIVKDSTGVAGENTKEYTFQRLAKLSSSISESCSTESSSSCGQGVSRQLNDSEITSGAVGYPKWVKNFHNDVPGENFMTFGWTGANSPTPPLGDPNADMNVDPTTTSLMAWIEKTQKTTETIETHTNVSTITRTDGAGDHIYCKMRIVQRNSSVSAALLYLLNPDFHPSLDAVRPTYTRRAGQQESGAFELCRGIWTFELTVMDACGEDAKSVDQFRLTVRCNRPPVAIACCDTTVVYKSATTGNTGEFPQVTVDGRHSSDADNERPGSRYSLTYYWTFLGYPTAHHDACVNQVQSGMPCEQRYCQQVLTGNYRTWVYVGAEQLAQMSSKSFGNVTRGNAINQDDFAGITAYDQKCGPLVYPPVYDFSDNGRANAPCIKPGNPLPVNVPGQPQNEHCRYKTIDNTEHHVGNSAYFKPTAPGEYKVQLAVFDGCSTVLDTAVITAVCPTIDGRIDVSQRTGTFYPGGSQQTTSAIKLFSFVQYAGANSALRYSWYYMSSAGGERLKSGIDNPAAPNATFTPQGSGTFTIFLELDDNCRRFAVGPAIQLNIGCNEQPQMTSVSVEPTQFADGSIRFDPVRLAFPTVTLTAAAVDADNDPLTFSWLISTRGPNDATRTNITDYLLGGAPRNNKLMFTPNLRMNPEPLSTYMISAIANDQCQNSVSMSKPLIFECNATLDVRLGPVPTPGSSFDYQIGQFETITLDTKASIFPYPQQNNYTWCIKSSGDCTNNNAPEAVAATTGRQNSVVFKPTEVGIYEVTLTVNDFCTERVDRTQIEASCPSLPTASLQLNPPAPAGSIEWDSFKSPYRGGFNTITLDASGSTDAVGATAVTPMTYSFSTNSKPLSSSVVNPIPRAGTSSAEVSLDLPGAYTFQLSVANGVACRSLSNPVVTFSANCIVIRLAMKDQQGVFKSAPGPVAFNSVWQGSAFSHIQLDARESSYRGSNIEGNYNSLRYTWTVLTSPEGSVFEKSGETAQVYQPSETGWDVAFVGSPRVTTDGNRTTTTTVYTKTRRATTTVTLTTLFNHHYNKPITAFRPDKAGSYSIELRVDDGCSTAQMRATITASCNAFVVPKPELRMADGSGFAGTLDLTGNSYQRVVMDARSTTPGNQCDTLTYEWTIISAPARSLSELTNPSGNVVSIVPDRDGVYVVSFSVYDGCNAKQTQEVTLNVRCPGNGILMSPPTVKVIDELRREKDSEEIWFTNATAVGNARFNYNYFRLTGQSSSNCTVRERRWYYTARRNCDCYIPRPGPPVLAPPPTACSATKTCFWRVKTLPCEYKTWNSTQYPVGCDREGCVLPPHPSLTQYDQCQAMFKCRAAGVYLLELTVGDGCSVKRETVPVTCRCAKELQVDVDPPQVNLKRCQPGGTRDFADMDIAGRYFRTPPASRAAPTPTVCEATSAPTMAPTAPAVSGQCCPAAAACAACTKCPECNACPIVIQGGGVTPVVPAAPVPGVPPGVVPDAVAPTPGAVPPPPSAPRAPVPGAVSPPDIVVPVAPQAPQAVTVPAPVPGQVSPSQRPADAAFTAAASESEDDEVSTALLLGVIIPISVIMVGSIIGNIILFGKFKAAAAAAQSADMGVQLSTSPTSVVVGRSV